jgi:hypothetical protein
LAAFIIVCNLGRTRTTTGRAHECVRR